MLLPVMHCLLCHCVCCCNCMHSLDMRRLQTSAATCLKAAACAADKPGCMQGPQAAQGVDEAEVPESDAADSSEDEDASGMSSAGSGDDNDDEARQRWVSALSSE